MNSCEMLVSTPHNFFRLLLCRVVDFPKCLFLGLIFNMVRGTARNLSVNESSMVMLSRFCCEEHYVRGEDLLQAAWTPGSRALWFVGMAAAIRQCSPRSA